MVGRLLFCFLSFMISYTSRTSNITVRIMVVMISIISNNTCHPFVVLSPLTSPPKCREACMYSYFERQNRHLLPQLHPKGFYHMIRNNAIFDSMLYFVLQYFTSNHGNFYKKIRNKKNLTNPSEFYNILYRKVQP